MSNRTTDENIKVAFLIDRIVHPNAGTEGQLLMLIEGLSERSINFELAVFHHSEYIQQISKHYVVRSLRVNSMTSIVSWWRLFNYLRELKKRQFRVLHLYFNDTSLMVPILGFCMGFKVVVSRRDMGFWYTPLRLKILRLNRYFTHAMVANSHAVKHHVCQQEGITLSHAHVIYNGLSKLQDMTPPTNVERSPRVTHIGLVANIRDLKRIDDLITAVALLDVSGAVMVHIAGDGDPSALILLANKFGIADNVQFHGRVQDVPAFLSSMDLCVLCSESEGLSNALIEYMRHEKPIVCSAIAANVELIRHLDDGLTYPVGDSRALADSLMTLIADRELGRRLACRAKERIHALCDREIMVNQHASLYGQLISPKTSD